MDEAELQSQAAGVALKLAEASTKGVYEERLPLDSHAALSLGCVALVASNAQSRNLAEGFSLNELQACSHDSSIRPSPHDIFTHSTSGYI